MVSMLYEVLVLDWLIQNIELSFESFAVPNFRSVAVRGTAKAISISLRMRGLPLSGSEDCGELIDSSGRATQLSQTGGDLAFVFVGQNMLANA